MNTEEKIQQKANKPMLESKKWLGAIIAVMCVMLVYFSSAAVLVFSSSDNAQHIVSISNVTITFLGMVFSSLILGVSAVDWKSMQSLTSVHTSTMENKSYEEKVERDIMIQYKKDITDEEDEDAPPIKPYTIIVD